MRFLPKKKLLLAFFFLSFSLFGTAGIHAQENATEAVLSRIADLLSGSNFNEAIALFDTIPLQERNSSRLRLLRASVLSSAGRYNEARTIVEAVISAEPRNTEPLFLLAAIEGVSGRRRQQQTALEKIIAIEPENIEALVSLGNVSLQNRAMRPAASYFHRVLTKDPTNAEALMGLSRAFRMNSEWDAAETLLNRVVDLYPQMVEARTDRARFHWGRGNMRQALADFDEAKRLAPNEFWVAVDRGNLLLEMNRRQDSLEEFNRAIAINPREHLPYIYTAGIKDDMGDNEGAEKDYETLTKLKPDYYFAFEGLGLHKMRKEKWAEAREAFSEAYKRAPEENLYALMVAINWMRMEDVTAPRSFLAQVQARMKRDTLEWYIFRLYYDLTARNYLGENDMVLRLDREQDVVWKARILFYMALYYEVRGNSPLANKYFLLVHEMDQRAIPEWRLNKWILTDRELIPF